MGPRVMTVGAFDVSGIAGIGVDAALVREAGGDALGVVSAIVNSAGGVYRPLATISAKDLARQARAAVALRPAAIKLGFLPDAAAVSAVVAEVGPLDVPIVADPVLWWGTAGFSLSVRALGIYCAALLPRVTVLTVDHAEAVELLGERLPPHELVRGLLAMGARWVILKGVATEALSDMVQDLVSDGHRWYAVQSPRPTAGFPPGAGAMFASVLAAHLAAGTDIPEAAGLARDSVNRRAAALPESPS